MREKNRNEQISVIIFVFGHQQCSDFGPDPDFFPQSGLTLVRILLDLAVVVVALSPDLCPAAVAAPFSATSAAANLLTALAEPFVWLFTDCTIVFTFLMGDENGVCVGESTTPCIKFSLVARIQQV